MAQEPTKAPRQIYEEVYNLILEKYGPTGDNLSEEEQSIQDLIKNSLKPFPCIKRSLYRSRASLGIVSKCENEYNYILCEICAKHFENEDALQNHKESHTKEMPYQCKTCKKRFADKSSFEEHEKTHLGEGPYECQICKKRFKHPS